jgi:hypothetical protein
VPRISAVPCRVQGRAACRGRGCAPARCHVPARMHRGTPMEMTTRMHRGTRALYALYALSSGAPRPIRPRRSGPACTRACGRWRAAAPGTCGTRPSPHGPADCAAHGSWPGRSSHVRLKWSTGPRYSTNGCAETPPVEHRVAALRRPSYPMPPLLLPSLSPLLPLPPPTPLLPSSPPLLLSSPFPPSSPPPHQRHHMVRARVLASAG